MCGRRICFILNMVIMYRFWILAGMLLLGGSTQAQTYEEWLEGERKAQQEMAKEQAEGLEKLKKEYDDFVKKRDQEFADFLKKRWVEFRVFKGELPPQEPKPREVPVALKKTVDVPVALRIKPEEDAEDKLVTRPLPRIRKSKDIKRPELQGVVCPFYGTEFAVNPDKELCRPYEGGLDEEGFSAYWLKKSETNYDELLDRLFGLKQQLGLSDWGYYMLVKKCSETLLKDENSRQLLMWFLLNKSGYIARLGYDREKVAVMLPAVQQIYEMPYVTGNGVRYYITRPLDKVLSYEGNFTGSVRKMDLRFTTALNFPENRLKQRKLSFRDTTLMLTYNSAVTDFYKDYPPTEWEVYFNAPLSAAAKESLSANLWSFLNGRTADEKTGILLKWLHQSFPYQTDEEQFGKEKYFFPEEVLAYPYSDCEDRAAFFACLERSFAGLPVVGLCYPGHVAAAVELEKGETGDYVSYDGRKYTICDPTYIGAEPGMSMPQFKNTAAEVIRVEGTGLSREREDLLAEILKKAGGVVPDREKNMLTDKAGNVYVSGVFSSSFQAGDRLLKSGGGRNVFVAKIDPQNRFVWAMSWEGKENNAVQELKWAAGDLLVSGVFEGKVKIGEYVLEAAEGPDVILVKLKPEGKIEWASAGAVPEEAADEGMHYLLTFAQNGKLLNKEIQPDEIGMPEAGIALTRRNEYVVHGSFNAWSGVYVAMAAGKQSVMEVATDEQLKALSDAEIRNQADKSMAGLLAVIQLINTNASPVSGEMAVRTLDKYNPEFKKRCPNIYKNIRKVDFIRNEDGIIQLKTLDGKPVNFDKVQVKDGSRMRAVKLPEENVQVQIIDGIKVGKAFIWFRLNRVTLYRSTGDMMFDYDSDHTLKTFNLGKDILN